MEWLRFTVANVENGIAHIIEQVAVAQVQSFLSIIQYSPTRFMPLRLHSFQAHSHPLTSEIRATRLAVKTSEALVVLDSPWASVKHSEERGSSPRLPISLFLPFCISIFGVTWIPFFPSIYLNFLSILYLLVYYIILHIS